MSLNDSSMICRMAMPMQNWNTALYSTACAAGSAGTGREIVVPGTGEPVKELKKSTILSQREVGRVVT